MNKQWIFSGRLNFIIVTLALIPLNINKSLYVCFYLYVFKLYFLANCEPVIRFKLLGKWINLFKKKKVQY